ncbi:MAG: hypothetical protein ACM30I_05600 [Gemmatimonas sp.]
MRALKLLVIGMGVLIVVATTALVAVIVNRAGKLAESSVRSEVPLAIPAGFHLVSTDVAGNRLVIRLEGRAAEATADETRLLIVDLDRPDRARIVRLVSEGAR